MSTKNVTTAAHISLEHLEKNDKDLWEWRAQKLQWQKGEGTLIEIHASTSKNFNYKVYGWEPRFSYWIPLKNTNLGNYLAVIWTPKVHILK